MILPPVHPGEAAAEVEIMSGMAKWVIVFLALLLRNESLLADSPVEPPSPEVLR